MTNEQLLKIGHDHLWLPFTQMKDYDQNPLVIESGNGIKLKDIDGNEYYDGFSSLWLNPLGHNVKELNQAINEQLEKIAHSTLLGMTSVPATELAKKLVDITPEGLNRVFYSDSGATAVEIAIKMAFQYWLNLGQSERKTFITMKNGYHGDTVGAISVGAIDLYHQIYKPLMFDSIVVPYPYAYRHESGDEETCMKDSIEQLKACLEENHEHVCGIICEPIMQGAGGMIKMPKGYLKKVRELCDTYGVLLICDEVATGFGRTGRLFAVEHEGVTPDIMTVGKMLTGGYLPIAVTLTTEKIYEAFYADYHELKTFFHGHSYTGNALGCAVALKNIELYEKHQIVDRTKEKAKYLEDLLHELYELPHVGDIRQAGFMCGIELVKDKKTKEMFDSRLRVGYYSTLEMRKSGMLTRPLGDVIVFMPPLISTKEELKVMVDLLKDGMYNVTKQAESEGVTR